MYKIITIILLFIVLISYSQDIEIKHFLLQFDFAYAYNNLTNSPGYFVQIKLGYT